MLRYPEYPQAPGLWQLKGKFLPKGNYALFIRFGDDIKLRAIINATNGTASIQKYLAN